MTCTRRKVAATALLVFALLGWTLEAAQVTLTDVPEYPNYYGCAPSSGAIVLGYWDAHGYPDLFPGEAMPFREEIGDLIASPRHLDDYWVGWNSPAIDPWMAEGWPRPMVADCLADNMFTSQYSTPDGWTNQDQVPNGLTYFVRQLDPDCDFDAYYYSSIDFAGRFKSEIDAGRPMILFVRLGATIDHAVVGYGYDDSDAANPRFAVMDLFLGNEPGTVDWWSWSRVYGGVVVEPISPPINSATANAGDDFFGYESRGAALYYVHLDGTASVDASTFLWQQIAGKAVTLSDMASAAPQFAAPQPDGSSSLTHEEATLIFRLTINAGISTQDSDDVQVYIRLPGDANGDDAVNAFDVAILRQSSLQMAPGVESTGSLPADFNGDGRVNAFDVAILRQYSGFRR